MSLDMLHDYVLIKADEQETETSSGFFLGDAADKPCTGVAVSVGPGKRDINGQLIDHGIKQGNKVVFPAAAMNQPLKHEGEDYYVMLAGQIFGVQR